MVRTLIALTLVVFASATRDEDDVKKQEGMLNDAGASFIRNNSDGQCSKDNCAECNPRERGGNLDFFKRNCKDVGCEWAMPQPTDKVQLGGKCIAVSVEVKKDVKPSPWGGNLDSVKSSTGTLTDESVKCLQRCADIVEVSLKQSCRAKCPNARVEDVKPERCSKDNCAKCSPPKKGFKPDFFKLNCESVDCKWSGDACVDLVADVSEGEHFLSGEGQSCADAGGQEISTDLECLEAAKETSPAFGSSYLTTKGDAGGIFEAFTIQEDAPGYPRGCYCVDACKFVDFNADKSKKAEPKKWVYKVICKRRKEEPQYQYDERTSTGMLIWNPNLKITGSSDLEQIFSNCAAYQKSHGFTPVWTGFLRKPQSNNQVILNLRGDKQPGEVFDDAETNHGLIVGAGNFGKAETIDVADASYLSWLDDQLDAVQSMKNCFIIVPRGSSAEFQETLNNFQNAEETGQTTASEEYFLTGDGEDCPEAQGQGIADAAECLQAAEAHWETMGVKKSYLTTKGDAAGKYDEFETFHGTGYPSGCYCQYGCKFVYFNTNHEAMSKKPDHKLFCRRS